MEAQVTLSPTHLPSSPRKTVVSELSDSVFLAVVVALSSVLYVSRLGFYSDDWSLLPWFVDARDQSLGGAFRALYGDRVRMRPGQIFYFALLYKSFGLEPLGYHLVNAGVFISAIVLFYFTLRELSVPRVIALTTPLVYALLPHYSTNRFWYASFGANLSVAAYFLSVFADLKAVAARRRWLVPWKAVSVFGLLASTLTYEVVLPLFLLSPVLLVQRARQSNRSGFTSIFGRRARILAGIGLLALAAILTFKIRTASRGGFPFSYWWWIRAFSEQVIIVNFGDLLVGLPRLVWQIVKYDPQLDMTIVGAGLGLLIAIYVYRLTKASTWPSSAVWLKCFGAGAGVFVLGYAIFLTNSQAWPLPFGIANRTSIAAAIGLALSLVSALGCVFAWVPVRFRRMGFCLSIAGLGIVGFLVINTIGSFWASAYTRQREVLADIRGRFTTLPSGTTFLLDGVCPYEGPAVVFESNWDLQGALRVLFREMDLRADVVTPNLSFDADGVSTALYGDRIITEYPYGPNVFVYHYRRKLVAPLPDMSAAVRYFNTVDPSRGADVCPVGQAGAGSAMF